MTTSPVVPTAGRAPSTTWWLAPEGAPVTALHSAPLWTVVEDGPDGLTLAVRGELSSATAPALNSLLEALVYGRETSVSIDLRGADVIAPAGERLLERWRATPDAHPGTYRFDTVVVPAH